jgi:hypothetical protein
MSFNETNFDRTNVGVRVVTDNEEEVDEFKRFHDDVLRAIEPLQSQIVPHRDSMRPTWQELLQQTGLAIPALNSGERDSASPSASPKHKLSLTGTMIGAAIAGVVIGVAIAATGTDRFNTANFSGSYSFGRLFGASPNAASVGEAPMTPGDLTPQSGPAPLSPPDQPADRHASAADDQRPAPPQTAFSETPSQPADVQQPAATDSDKSRASGNAEAAPSSIGSVPALTNESVSSLSVTMPPKDDPGLARKFSEAQASRSKPQVLQGRSGAKRAGRPKVLRPRATVPDASINRASSSSRSRRLLDQDNRKDPRDEAAGSRGRAR